MRKLSLILTLICLGLTGCQTGEGLSERAAPVLGGSLRVGLPAGYCVDQAASTDRDDSAVLFLGRCSQSNNKQPALISITIGKSASAGVMTAGGAALAQFFESNEGRATLSRNGRAADVTLISASGSDRLLRLHLRDRSLGEYWRAITTMQGRLVTISTVGTKDYPLSSQAGRALLDATLQALKRGERSAP